MNQRKIKRTEQDELLILKQLNKSLRFLLICGPLIFALGILYDPISLPKFLILTTVSAFVLGLLFQYRPKENEKMVFSFIGIFSCSLIISFIANGPTLNSFFGIFGRNTGLVTYLCLCIVFIQTYILGRNSFETVSNSLIVVSFVNALYGLVQYFGFDPLPWNNPYNSIVGTLGNPNFTSALMGLGGIVFFYKFNYVQKQIPKLLYFSMMLLIAYLCYKSESIQGFFILLIGIFLYVFLVYFWKISYFLRIVLFISYVMVFVSVVSGFLQFGPLKNLVYQNSISYRGDYWRAGLRMFLNHPIFGVGLDNYAFWYQYSRDSSAVARSGTTGVSNSAHNVFIDLAVGGGVVLFVTYMLITLLVGYTFFKTYIFTKQNLDHQLILIFVLWFCYIIQSTVSINNLGLAIFGWSLGGCCLGLIHSHKTQNLSKIASREELLGPKSLLIALVMSVFGFSLAIAPVIKDYGFYQAIKQQNDVKLVLSEAQWPQLHQYSVLAATILMGQGELTTALKISKASVARNPRGFPSWLQIYENPVSTIKDKSSALIKLRELDPLNANYASAK